MLTELRQAMRWALSREGVDHNSGIWWSALFGLACLALAVIATISLLSDRSDWLEGLFAIAGTLLLGLGEAVYLVWSHRKFRHSVTE